MKKILFTLMGLALVFVSNANVSIMSGAWSYQPPVPAQLLKKE